MPVAAKVVVRRASDILKDATGVRWPADELVRWLNDGQRELAILRPDAAAVIKPLALAAGFRQSLPATAIKLIDIPNNAGGTMATVRQVQRAELDVLLPAWRTATASASVKHFMHDPRVPRVFEVYPPVLAGTTVDAAYAEFPVDVVEPAANSDWNAVAGNIGVPDIYTNALVDYVLSRAFSKDSELTVNAARAQGHYQAFANALGVEVSATAMVAPDVNAPGAVRGSS